MVMHGTGRIFVLAFSLLCGVAGVSLPAEVTVRTSSESYEIGDTIEFEIVSYAAHTITFPSSPIYAIYDSTGFEVYPFTRHPETVYWEPGRSETYAWPDGFTGGPAREGRYSVSVDYYAGSGGPLLSAVDTFHIISTGCITECNVSSWGQIKSLFR
jgi:hypothetical protein